VCEHHALGEPGRATGVEHAGDGVPAPPGVGDWRGAGHQVLVRQQAVGRRSVAGVYDRAQPRVGATELGDHRREGVVDDEQRGLRVGQ
jgi:hypothetical protein